MYAIIEDGSRQYRAEEGKTLVLDYRDDVKVGDSIELTKVLLVEKDGTARIGQPLVVGVKVLAEVTGFPKVKTVAQSYRRRKASKRLRGHTQPHIRVAIKSIVG